MGNYSLCHDCGRTYNLSASLRVSSNVYMATTVCADCSEARLEAKAKGRPYVPAIEKQDTAEPEPTPVSTIVKPKPKEVSMPKTNGSEITGRDVKAVIEEALPGKNIVCYQSGKGEKRVYKIEFSGQTKDDRTETQAAIVKALKAKGHKVAITREIDKSEGKKQKIFVSLTAGE